MATVDIHYAQAALRCAERKGLQLAPLIAAAGIDPLLLGQAKARVYAGQMTRLVQLVWAQLQDEFMGCTAQRCKPGSFALMTRYVLPCETLAGVLQRGIEFYNLITDDIQMSLQHQGNTVELCVRFARPELDPDHYYQEFWLVIWHRFASWLIGKKIPLQQVSFNYAKPSHHQQLKQLFPCRQRFAQATLSLTFSAEYLRHAPVRTERELSVFLKRSPADLITIPGDEQRYSALIRSQLLRQDGAQLHCPAFDDLAKHYRISAQTLRRRLQREGTSYPQLKEEIRRDLAIEKLLEQRLPIKHIAEQLGFSDARSFTRAFKQWTDLTPSAYVVATPSR